jgi:hypothetical protein
VTTVVFALFQGLVRQRGPDPDTVPPEPLGRALRWLFDGMADRPADPRTREDRP